MEDLSYILLRKCFPLLKIKQTKLNIVFSLHVKQADIALQVANVVDHFIMWFHSQGISPALLLTDLNALMDSANSFWVCGRKLKYKSLWLFFYTMYFFCSYIKTVFLLVTALFILLAPASDDEGSTAATDGSTLRTSPADHGGSVGSESGGSAVDSVAGEHSGEYVLLEQCLCMRFLH